MKILVVHGSIEKESGFICETNTTNIGSIEFEAETRN